MPTAFFGNTVISRHGLKAVANRSVAPTELFNSFKSQKLNNLNTAIVRFKSSKL
ncbi:hypothetical protein MM236_06465 [Belliella sp. DSM 107340]|uniref:Uncharacterized protein n=1 Tax=Belliella calami TaxID=2923436 RepID=A0ABS9ULZ1_9BACT|nr:hypothetical protein [Belliella calami]MCH7397623.1 hypothetical protein [Belliella calami]